MTALCEEFQRSIADALETQLAEAQHSRVAGHLAGCAACRTFAEQLGQLDARLVRAIKAPVPPANFKAVLQQRIQSTVVLSGAEREKRKCELQAEYEAGLARLRFFHLPSRRLLNSFGYVSLAASACVLAWLSLPRFEHLLAQTPLSGSNQSLLFSLVTGGIFVAISLGAAFPGKIKRFVQAV